MEKARKSHLARVVLMDITVVVTYNNDLSCDELKAGRTVTQMTMISRMRAVRALEAVVASTLR